LWWRKLIAEWLPCNAFGKLRFNDGTTNAVPTPSFTSLKLATEWLNGINGGKKNMIILNFNKYTSINFTQTITIKIITILRAENIV
jgi:hypothetical protein